MALVEREGDRSAGRCHGNEGSAGTSSIRQRAGVRADTGAKTLYIEPGSPWENGFCESFNSKLRDEFLSGELFYSMKELRVLAERWRVHYNTVRPHSSLGYRPPASEAWMTSTTCHTLHRSDLRGQCATLTPHWHKTSGNPLSFSPEDL